MKSEGEIGGEWTKNSRRLKTLKIFTRRDNPGRDEGARDRKEGSEFRGESGRELSLAQGWISRIIDRFHQKLFTGSHT